MKTTLQPEAATGDTKLADNVNPVPRFGSKRDVAVMLQMSVRSVDNFLRAGMPCIKLSKRRCRFDLLECRQWFKTQFGQQRRA
jgi:hypothetical protein